ncbi:MAG: hypothetical protein ACLTKL_03020 [Streptococcus salivarius]
MRLSETSKILSKPYAVADYDELDQYPETGGSYEVTSQAITGQGRNDLRLMLCLVTTSMSGVGSSQLDQG